MAQTNTALQHQTPLDTVGEMNWGTLRYFFFEPVLPPPLSLSHTWLGKNWLARRGGGGLFEPLSWIPPPLLGSREAPVTGTPDGLTVTPQQADRGGGGGS